MLLSTTNLLSIFLSNFFSNPLIIKEAIKELEQRVGDDFVYKALLGDRKPPLNYRVN